MLPLCARMDLEVMSEKEYFKFPKYSKLEFRHRIVLYHIQDTRRGVMLLIDMKSVYSTVPADLGAWNLYDIYIYIYIYIYMCVCVCVRVCVCQLICLHPHTHTDAHAHTHEHTHAVARACACVRVCVCVRASVCVPVSVSLCLCFSMSVWSYMQETDFN